MKKALLVIDIQNDYFEGGNAELFEPIPAMENAKKLMNLFHRKNEPVIYIQHINTYEGADFFLPDSDGNKIYSEIQPLSDDLVFIKHEPDSFLSDGLTEYLKGQNIDELVICGMMSHMCVDTTVRSAKAKGYEVTLLEDACTTMDLEWQGERYPAKTVHQIYMASLSGVFATVMTTDAYIESGR